MILWRGAAQTEEAIIAEYRTFLQDYRPGQSIKDRMARVPETMMNRIGKPFTQWTDDDLIQLFQSHTRSARNVYMTFLAFLFFQGYRRATIHLLGTLQPALGSYFKPATNPLRERLKQTQQELNYSSWHAGSELNLLLYLLSVVSKPLEELTRADFEAFREEYLPWFRHERPYANGKPDPHLYRLEVYLVHWGIIPPARVVFRHEEYFSRLRQTPLRDAYLTYMNWCDARYKPATIVSHRAALLNFFLWLQEQYPNCLSLDNVSRSVALDFARYLKHMVEEGTYSNYYSYSMYCILRQFFNFAIDERLETSPTRNPFGLRDMPPRPRATPRYLSDHEVRTVLAYCDNGATLKEKTLVITLLHTGIRASEMAAIKVSDIVQIQGTWKLHIRQGKGLKDRIVPLTPQCLDVLQTWQREGWERVNEHLFTRHGKRWRGGKTVCYYIRELGRRLDINRLTPHRFRHTFAVALLNYGMRESALQKLMGHETVAMTLEYARILDKSVEQAFNTAVEQMQTGPASWVPSFFNQDEYALMAHDDKAINWIRLAHGFCRRHPKLHCESDVKCLLCDRYCGTSADLPRLQEMHDQFLYLGMPVKAEVINAHIVRLQGVAVTHTPSIKLVEETHELATECSFPR